MISLYLTSEGLLQNLCMKKMKMIMIMNVQIIIKCVWTCQVLYSFFDPT